MVTCFLRYQIDPTKLDDFEEYGKKWIGLVQRLGGSHHGYFLPSEGASDVALAMFTFPTLAAYERYRVASFEDAECKAAMEFWKQTRCFLRYDRSFFRPVFSS